jgi:hypothetical protein
MEDLLNALDNESNAYLLQLSHDKIKKEKNDILQQIQLRGAPLKMLHEKLQDYRYITDANSLINGSYIRWINLKKMGETIPGKILTNGAIICDWKLYDNGLYVVCKTNNYRVIQIKFDETLIFQKLSSQEQVLLSVIDYVSK